jgi:hypothetical protein
VHRFRFENFAGRVGDLVSSYLMRSAAAEAK